mgnify:FL=1
MDTIITKKHKKLKKILIMGVPVLLLVLFAVFTFTQKKTLNVKRDEISIREATQGKFEDILIVNGKIESLHTSLLNVIEGGAVQEIYKEDGQMVTKGEPLVLVYNPNTNVNYLSQETGIIQQINQLRSTQVQIKGQGFSLEKEKIQAQNDYNLSEQEYMRQKRLYEAEIGKKADLERAQEIYNYQKKRMEVVNKSMLHETKDRELQTSNVQSTIKQLESILGVMRANKKNFLISAPASGRLTSFDVQIGQNLNSGQAVGKVDLMDGYKLTAQVDEFYINKLSVGLEGAVEVNQLSYAVVVSKILPEVKNGQFSIEVHFKNKAPENLKIGMNFSIKLTLSEPTQSIMIPKGNFFKDTGGKWIFVMSSENKATKRAIELGRENPLYYEVISGIKPGEKVIVSDYSDYKNVQELTISK